jgi:hypothetical protein
MKPQTQFRRVMSVIGIFLLIGIAMYGFLALCNWELHLKDWTGFSRFLMGVLGLIFLVRILDEL